MVNGRPMFSRNQKWEIDRKTGKKNPASVPDTPYITTAIEEGDRITINIEGDEFSVLVNGTSQGIAFESDKFRTQ